MRGYSHAFYNRGQDSAGILIYEQSSNNIVAFNSVTHGGDGLFLWAGQSTMDTGDGGANDNLFYGNDFSFAPTNGIEATFSRNVFSATASRSAGTASGAATASTRGSRQPLREQREAIAIEHGQDNRITENRFDGDETAIRLWKNPTQDPNWGYPKQRDTRSRDYVIAGNTFTGNAHRAEDHRDAERPRPDQRVREGRHGRALAGDTRNLGIGDEVMCRCGRARRSTSRCRSRCPAAIERRSPTPRGAAATRSSSTNGGPTTGSPRSSGPTAAPMRRR